MNQRKRQALNELYFGKPISQTVQSRRTPNPTRMSILSPRLEKQLLPPSTRSSSVDPQAVVTIQEKVKFRNQFPFAHNTTEPKPMSQQPTWVKQRSGRFDSIKTAKLSVQLAGTGTRHRGSVVSHYINDYRQHGFQKDQFDRAKRCATKLKHDHCNDCKRLTLCQVILVMAGDRMAHYQISSRVDMRRDMSPNGVRQVQQNLEQAKKERDFNQRCVIVDSVNLGSRWRSTHEDKQMPKTVYQYLNQPIGKKAVDWKTKTIINFDHAQTLKQQRQPPTSKQIDLFDIKAQKTMSRDNLIKNIAKNFKKTRQEIKTVTQQRDTSVVKETVLNTSATDNLSEKLVTVRRRFSQTPTITERVVASPVSRYAHTPLGDSVRLKVVPNCEISPKEHFRSVSARASDQVNQQPIKIQSRRQDFIQKIVSVNLGGSSHSLSETSNPAQKFNYTPVGRYDNTHKPVLNVFDVSKSKHYSDQDPTTTAREHQKDSMLHTPRSAAQDEYEAIRKASYQNNFALGTSRETTPRAVDRSNEFKKASVSSRLAGQAIKNSQQHAKFSIPMPSIACQTPVDSRTPEVKNLVQNLRQQPMPDSKTMFTTHVQEQLPQIVIRSKAHQSRNTAMQSPCRFDKHQFSSSGMSRTLHNDGHGGKQQFSLLKAYGQFN